MPGGSGFFFIFFSNSSFGQMPLPLAPHQSVHCKTLSLHLKIHCFNWVNLKQSEKRFFKVYEKTIKIFLKFNISFLHRWEKLESPVVINCNYWVEKPPASIHVLAHENANLWAVHFCTCIISKINNTVFRMNSSSTLTTFSVC